MTSYTAVYTFAFETEAKDRTEALKKFKKQIDDILLSTTDFQFQQTLEQEYMKKTI